MAESSPLDGIPIVAVVTSSSNTGKACVDHLLRAAPAGKVAVRAVFRTDEKAAPFRELHPDVEVVTGVDAALPDTLAPAFRGARVAVIVTPHSPDPGHDMASDSGLCNNMVHAAVAAGVSHVVYIGSWTVHYPSTILASRFVPTETLLQSLAAEGKVTFTVLRSGFFCTNLVAAFKATIAAGNFISTPPGYDFAPCDPADIGRVAAVVGADLGAGHEGQFYEISGPRRLRPSDFASTMTAVLGRAIEHRPVAVEDLKGKVPPYLFEVIEIMDSKGAEAIPFSDITGKLVAHHTPFEEWAAANKSAFE